jgi:hypothetical protein
VFLNHWKSIDFFHDHLSIIMCIVQIHVFIYFCRFSCWLLDLVHYDQIKYDLFQFSCIYKSMSYVVKYDLFWRTLHWQLRRMYIVWMLARIFCKYEVLWPIGSFYSVYLLIFLYDLPFGDNEVLKPHTIFGLLSTWSFVSSSILWNWMYWCLVHICLQ